MAAKVTYSIMTVHAVRIRGEGGGAGYLPADDGLVQKFLQWMIEKEVYGLSGFGGHSGGGTYLGFFTYEDACKAQEWLIKNGTDLDDEKTWEKR